MPPGLQHLHLLPHPPLLFLLIFLSLIHGETVVFTLYFPQFVGTSSPTTRTLEIVVRSDWQPLGAARFVELADNGYYKDSSLFGVSSRYVQFGISSNTTTSSFWRTKTIADDSTGGTNLAGAIGFTNNGANTRATQCFINTVDNPSYDTAGLKTFAQITSATLSTLGYIYSGYQLTPKQSSIYSDGATYLQTNFPLLTIISGVEVKRTITSMPSTTTMPTTIRVTTTAAQTTCGVGYFQLGSVCQIIDNWCVQPSAPSGGFMYCTGTTVSSVCAFLCRSDLTLVGAQSTTCGATNTFVPDPPVCINPADTTALTTTMATTTVATTTKATTTAATTTKATTTKATTTIATTKATTTKATTTPATTTLATTTEETTTEETTTEEATTEETTTEEMTTEEMTTEEMTTEEITTAAPEETTTASTGGGDGDGGGEVTSTPVTTTPATTTPKTTIKATTTPSTTKASTTTAKSTTTGTTTKATTKATTTSTTLPFTTAAATTAVASSSSTSTTQGDGDGDGGLPPQQTTTTPATTQQASTEETTASVSSRELTTAATIEGGTTETPVSEVTPTTTTTNGEESNPPAHPTATTDVSHPPSPPASTTTTFSSPSSSNKTTTTPSSTPTPVTIPWTFPGGTTASASCVVANHFIPSSSSFVIAGLYNRFDLVGNSFALGATSVMITAATAGQCLSSQSGGVSRVSWSNGTYAIAVVRAPSVAVAGSSVVTCVRCSSDESWVPLRVWTLIPPPSPNSFRLSTSSLVANMFYSLSITDSALWLPANVTVTISSSLPDMDTGCTALPTVAAQLYPLATSPLLNPLYSSTNVSSSTPMFVGTRSIDLRVSRVGYLHVCVTLPWNYPILLAAIELDDSSISSLTPTKFAVGETLQVLFSGKGLTSADRIRFVGTFRSCSDDTAAISGSQSAIQPTSISSDVISGKGGVQATATIRVLGAGTVANLCYYSSASKVWTRVTDVWIVGEPFTSLTPSSGPVTGATNLEIKGGLSIDLTMQSTIQVLFVPSQTSSTTTKRRKDSLTSIDDSSFSSSSLSSSSFSSFSSSPSQRVQTFTSQPCKDVVLVNVSQINCNSPGGVGGGYQVQIFVAGRLHPSNLTWNYNPPLISGTIPTELTDGKTITIIGSDFGNENANIDSVLVDNINADETTWISSSSIVIKLANEPTATGKSSLRVNVGGQMSNDWSFMYSRATSVVSVEMKGDVASFDRTSFLTDMAQVIGVTSSQIVIVSISAGSVIVDFRILLRNKETETTLFNKIEAAVENGAFFEKGVTRVSFSSLAVSDEGAMQVRAGGISKMPTWGIAIIIVFFVAGLISMMFFIYSRRENQLTLPSSSLQGPLNFQQKKKNEMPGGEETLYESNYGAEFSSTPPMSSQGSHNSMSTVSNL